LLDGRHYYSHPFGLTDSNGRVSATAAAIQGQFEDNQRFFIMDYKVPLLECEGTGVVDVLGDRQFAQRRDGLDPRWVKPEWVELWRRARNGEFRSAAVRVPLDGTALDVLVSLSDVKGSSHVRAV